MDPKEARKAIARDVISLLKSRRFIASPGTYFALNASEVVLVGDDDLRDKVGRKRCDVCAIGAAIVARALREDQISVSQASNGELSTLSGIFESQQLREMEWAFEVERYLEGDGCSCNMCQRERKYHLKKKSVQFGMKFKKPGPRLLAIWENVLKNDGEFVP